MRHAIIIMCVAALAACETESYDSGQGNFSLTRADFVEAHADGECAVDYVITDNGDSLGLTARRKADWIVRPDTLYRAVFYYDRVGGSSAKPVGMSPVPTLPVKRSEDYKAVLTDPVRFESAWVSATGKYLNIGIYLKVGEGDNADARHSIGVACDSTVRNADGTRTSFVRLYHDQGGVPEYYSAKYYVSMVCDSFNADSVCLMVNTYDGMVVRRIGLKKG